MLDGNLSTPTAQFAWTRQAEPSSRMSVNSHLPPFDWEFRLEIIKGEVPCGRHPFLERAQLPKNVCCARTCPSPPRPASVASSHLSSRESPLVALKLRSASRE